MAVPVGKPGDLQPPPGVGAGLAIGGYWPSISETDIQDIADEHGAAAKSFSDYADMLQMQLAQSSELLEGQGGTARIALLTTARDHAVKSADHTQSKVVTAEDYKSTVVGLKRELITIGDDAQKDWEKARSSKRVFDPTLYQDEAATAYSTALKDVAKAPPPLPMPSEDAENANTGEQPSAGKDELKPGEALPGEKQVDPDTTEAEATFASDRKGDELGPFESLPDEESGTAPLGNTDDSERPVTEITGATNDQSGLPLGGAPVGGMGGAGMPSGGASAGSLGSQLGSVKPPQVPSSGASSLGGKSLADAATKPASSLSDAFGGSNSPLSSAANNFQTGLASGMGSSGAVSPPLEKFTGPQHPAASLSAPGPQAAPVVPAQGGPPASAGAGLGPVMGGGGMAPPMMPPGGAGAGGGALPPYVPPGAGTGAAVPPAGASTGPASGSSAPGSVQQSGGPAAGGAPVVAGSGAGAAAGLPDVEVNPDLLLAQRVLDGLVRGTNATSETFNGGWIRWAVSVLQTPAGDTRTVIASSVGAGLYLPEGVVFPVTAQLATLDPALPWGWGNLFMGWDKPTSVLTAHADELCNIGGLRRSALATTEENAERPAGWDDFATVSAAAPGAAPSLGGEYQHRLASISAELNGRVNEFDSKLHPTAAAMITEAVSASAKQLMTELPVGMAPLIDTYDLEHVLGPLSRGEQVDWDAHYQHLAARAEGAVLHPIMAGGLLDLDDSEASNHSRVVYMHHYRAGLLAEMLRSWRSGTPSLHDIVYCAVAAGFPPADVIEALKRAGTRTS